MNITKNTARAIDQRGSRSGFTRNSAGLVRSMLKGPEDQRRAAVRRTIMRAVRRKDSEAAGSVLEVAYQVDRWSTFGSSVFMSLEVTDLELTREQLGEVRRRLTSGTNGEVAASAHVLSSIRDSESMGTMIDLLRSAPDREIRREIAFAVMDMDGEGLFDSEVERHPRAVLLLGEIARENPDDSKLQARIRGTVRNIEQDS